MSGQHVRQPSADDVRNHIISSLFTKRGDDGTPEETLISYLKVYEDDGGDGSGPKTRYLMLAVTKLGKVVIHKAKRNNNLSFSKGKTWQLEDMRCLEVIGPLDFALTMTIRRYHWSTERAKDQSHFLNSVVKVYRTYTKGELPELINFSMAPSGTPIPSGNGAPPPLDRNGSSSSPLPRGMELAPPPPLRQTRSGSSSSHTSGQSSFYPASDSASRGRPSMDEEQRTPTAATFGRSPLGEPSMLRTSASEISMGRAESPRGPPHPSTNGGNGPIGMGPPPIPPPAVQSRKLSEDRLGPSALRNISAASEYDQPGSAAGRMMRKASNEGMRAINEVTRGEGSRSSSSRGPPPSQPQRRGTDESNTLQPAEQPHQTKMLTPLITTTEPSPNMPSEPKLPTPQQVKPSRRASFHPPPLDTTFSREVLLTSRTGVLPGAAGMTVDDGTDGGLNDEAVLANVEDLLEGFDWTEASNVVGENGKKKGSADAIEGRLLDELAALDSANIHAFLESDDRIAQVLGHIDEALLELDDIDMQITGYRMQLNAVSDDISYIESQNRGLQVQTSNQQALLNELRQLLQIVEVPSEDLRTLTQESPQTAKGVQTLEQAAASLYKALQAGMDSANAEVAATIARMQEYREQSAQFCKRVSDYLDVTFKYQSDTTLSEYRKTSKKTMTLAPHTAMGEYLMTYEGLVLYVKEMDEVRYQKLCSNYMSTISQLHQSEMKDMLMNFMASLNATAGDHSNEAAFSSAIGNNPSKPSALLKSKNVIGLGLGNQQAAKKERKGGDNLGRASELYRQALTEIINQIVQEEDFINAFLHLTDTESTFADHMELDSYFRRQAARHASRGMSNGMMQLVRSMMDLIFGFVEMELRQWIEAAVEKGPVAIIGVIAVTERLAMEAEEENTSIFFAQMFDKQLARQRQILDMFVNEQIRTIESSKITMRKRKGVAFFVKHFPIFVEKMESQLDGYDDLPIRSRVNDIYEKVVNSVFGSLQQLAKMDRADGQATEDKGQLNYHVIMIENMHQFVEDLSRLDSPVLGVFLQRAKGLYDENLSTYLKLMIRRSFAKFIDFFDGVERLSQTIPPNEVSLHQSYNRSALKKVLKDHSVKDMRKAIDAMSKRVDKHFGEDDDPSSSIPTTSSNNNTVLIQTVWKEITNELLKETTKAVGIINKSYGDSGLSLEFGGGDVDLACKRARGGA
ncbi:hypothetical protein CI109_106900 [Kwoniella shandongensis]|uniref:Uncharacterized protein n=1 Tax=Kwoniella shandongensis TaxID=1734106 RepID=A0A5M6C6A5_9TREE|nr:uncharacterized protein CI109_000844 [Kwoniella shandongensis]KAA5530664.1 hypothetical protein CI109_000844 [Kwoniella shandongensis]